AFLAGQIAPHSPSAQFADYVYAPPVLPRVIDADGGWHRPFVYPIRLADRLERRYVEDRSRRIPFAWSPTKGLAAGVQSAAPWLPLGGDALGRDLLSRLLYGARPSLGIAAIASAGALLIGAVIGAAAGFAGGRLDDLLMRMADAVIVLPAVYVA